MQLGGGRVLLQRFFSLAQEVDLPVALAALGARAQQLKVATNARHVLLPSPPLQVALAAPELGDGAPGIARAWARLYDVGGLAVTFEVAIEAQADSEAWVAMAAQLGEREREVSDAAKRCAIDLRQSIQAACRVGPAPLLCEDYTIFVPTGPAPGATAQGLMDALDIPRLLLGELGPIAAGERAERLRAAFSYRPDDLTVIDWNSALVLDPTGGADVIELIELVGIQMLELKAYDWRVGRALDGLYQDLDLRQSGWFRASRFSRLSRRIMKLYVDILESSERIDNALTLFADTFLARVHRAAIAEFGVLGWQRQLRGKLEVLRQINQLLVDQVTSQKTLGIETAIVGLILVEVVMKVLELLHA